MACRCGLDWSGWGCQMRCLYSGGVGLAAHETLRLLTDPWRLFVCNHQLTSVLLELGQQDRWVALAQSHRHRIAMRSHCCCHLYTKQWCSTRSLQFWCIRVRRWPWCLFIADTYLFLQSVTLHMHSTVRKYFLYYLLHTHLRIGWLVKYLELRGKAGKMCLMRSFVLLIFLLGWSYEGEW